MPEGVEVRLSAELIKPLVVGKTTAVFFMSGRYQLSNPEGLQEFADKSKVLDVQTKGKFMYWSFENDEWYMFNTFGMSGQWSPKKGKHPALGITFVDGSEVYFNDPRHFGTIKFVKGKEKLKEKLNNLGWDPLEISYNESVHKFITLHLQSPKYSTKCIGEILMDQSLFAGVGNYVRAESLYRAKISPWRLSRDLTNEEIVSLCQSVVYVMQESYDHQGATILTYKDAYGAEGKYSSCFKVYGKKTDPLGNTIKKETTPDKRAIHWCPAIQV